MKNLKKLILKGIKLIRNGIILYLKFKNLFLGFPLVKSLVDNVVMPIITPFIPGGAWQTATFNMGPIVIGWGAFVGALINFLVIAWVVFLIAKFVLREEKVTKK